ncbi:heme peroxidase [Dimargaris verticillata]|uniref:Peroxidase n=1 Tax=Dimargaris verticillata TaxID=2761393 RepID=A0A9W8AX94_9FUNG|nr:heme peroxidase [Dimargaris verticillata]
MASSKLWMPFRLAAARGPARSTAHLGSARAALAARAYTSSAGRTTTAAGLHPLLGVAVSGVIGFGLAYYIYAPQNRLVPYTDDEKVDDIKTVPEQKSSHAPWKQVDYHQVYKDIAALMEEGAEGYDDGSYGPVLVRLAWHSSGTYSKHDKTGGSNGATMRYSPESNHGANRGLDVARHLLEKVKLKHHDISYADLYTLGGVVAVQEMGGPQIPWRPGRSDATANKCTPDGRLPDAALGQDHVRDIFYRMGFNDQEIAALVGAHALGRCHVERSGFDGPWTFSPTSFTNDYYNQLLNQQWVKKDWTGPFQFVDKDSKSIMMLPADMAFKEDKNFRKYVELYAKDEDQFFKDFSKAYAKLLELGVDFPKDSPTYRFPAL